jgi:hypothetical protein
MDYVYDMAVISLIIKYCVVTDQAIQINEIGIQFDVGLWK